jgi:hypothetical protein
MFKMISPQYAVDEDNDISLEATGLYSFLYKQNEKHVEISSEPLKKDDEYSVCMYLSDIKVWNNDNEEITDEEKEAIKANLISALKTLNMNAEFD